MALPRVLIVHDDPRARRFLSRVLAESCDVSVAKDGGDALTRVTAERFDAILSDIGTARHAGGFLDAVEATSPLSEVILVGGSRGCDLYDGGARDGRECVPDPFDPDAAMGALHRALERKALRAEIERLRRQVGGMR